MRAWLPIVLILPTALTGCPAVLSDWTISSTARVMPPLTPRGQGLPGQLRLRQRR